MNLNLALVDILDFSKVLNVALILAAIALAFLYLRSNSQKQAYEAEKNRADVLDKLLKIREAELIEKTKESDLTKAALEAVTGEYKTLAGIAIKELYRFDALNREIETNLEDIESLKTENRRLRSQALVGKESNGD